MCGKFSQMYSWLLLVCTIGLGALAILITMASANGDRVREIVEWSGVGRSRLRRRNRRRLSESATRHAMPRSEPIPSK